MLREGIVAHAGYEINTEGDSFHIAFASVHQVRLSPPTEHRAAWASAPRYQLPRLFCCKPAVLQRQAFGLQTSCSCPALCIKRMSGRLCSQVCCRQGCSKPHAGDGLATEMLASLLTAHGPQAVLSCPCARESFTPRQCAEPEMRLCQAVAPVMEAHWPKALMKAHWPQAILRMSKCEETSPGHA